MEHVVNYVDKQHLKNLRNMKKLLYKFKSGRNSKFKAYVSGLINQFTPRWISTRRIKNQIAKISTSSDFDYILSRVNYYNKLEEKTTPIKLSDNAKIVGDFKHKKRQLMYYIDLNAVLRGFPKDFKYEALFGDITTIPETPSFVKSRPISDANNNAVILKLNSIRHFNFIYKDIPLNKKTNKVIFRGKVHQQHRLDFFEKYFNNQLFDLGDTSNKPKHNNSDWLKEKMTLKEQLKNKFVLCIEGNDTSTSLKWVMSSNSIAVMPRPKYETWFMEGTLIPNVHYIEIADDYSDAEEKINYYIEHEEEALAILDNAHKFVEQFKDTRRERIIGWLVANKYFKATSGKQF